MTTPLAAQKPSEKELLGDNDEIVRLENVFRQKYGPDQKLINGKQYDNLHVWSTGHKFFGEDKYQEGKLVMENRVYDHVSLKYDIYNQQVILRYGQEGMRHREIIVNGLRLDEFHLGDKVFKKCYFPETDTVFLQIFEGEQCDFLYHWRKELIPIIRGKYNRSEFSYARRKSFVLIPSGVYGFSNARSFADIFPQQRNELLKFIHKHKIRLRKASDQQIRELHRYCNQVLDKSLASQ